MHADNSDVASDLSSPEDFRGNEAAEQLERDIRAATRPLKVEPTRSIRQHKILVVGPSKHHLPSILNVVYRVPILQ